MGREAIIPFCDTIRKYFDSVTTDFTQLSLIENENAVAINGVAKFYRDQELISQISSCDVYRFDEQLNIISIYS